HRGVGAGEGQVGQAAAGGKRLRKPQAGDRVGGEQHAKKQDLGGQKDPNAQVRGRALLLGVVKLRSNGRVAVSHGGPALASRHRLPRSPPAWYGNFPSVAAMAFPIPGPWRSRDWPVRGRRTEATTADKSAAARSQRPGAKPRPR